jgi:CO/xanthine dehydrogenase FAD-binding subunit
MTRPLLPVTRSSPFDDVRLSAGYRRAVAGRVLRRLLRDEGGW